MKSSDFPAPLESVEQAAFIRWCRLETNIRKYPGLELMHCSLNGVKLTKGQAGKAKGQGMLAGIPDLFLPVAREGMHTGYRVDNNGLYIEMKRLKGSALKQSQKVIIPMLEKQEFKVVVAKGCNEAIQAVEDYYA